MLAVASLFFSALRPQIETWQPAEDSACAMPRPMPPLPPVTTATRPVRSNRVMGVFLAFPSCVETLAARSPTVRWLLYKHGQGGADNQICSEMQIHCTA